MTQITKMFDSTDELAVAVLRGLAMDGPQRANSGHPGTAMALSPLAHVLFSRVIKFDPTDLDWPDRDRFILSCGHASILIYSILHLIGAGLTLDDLKNFRVINSRTPGHPEVGLVPGIEVTTGPLGQGLGNAIGMAIAERILREHFSENLVNHRIWVICSDGDFMEGISHEAGSLAGHLGLDNLTVIYDNNHITIDGSTELAYSDDVKKRFESYGWEVIDIGEAFNDLEAIYHALTLSKSIKDKPTLIMIRSHIGYPSPHKTDTSAAHGEPLGDEEIKLTKQILGLPPDEQFYVPKEVYSLYKEHMEKNIAARKRWQKLLENSPNETKQSFYRFLEKKPLEGFSEALPKFEPGTELATRKALQNLINATKNYLPFLVAGSADLTGNTGVALQESVNSKTNKASHQIAFGIREHVMGAAMTGIALHGSLLPIGGTFFVFSDYLRPTLRLAAFSKAHVIYSFTHDSIGLGQDGPTHQPIEHLASLRAIPDLCVIRPADANECAKAWEFAVASSLPVALVLTRQNVPVLSETLNCNIELGAYLVKSSPDPRITLVASGSELSLALKASDILNTKSIQSNVVSMPSWDLFDKTPEQYKEKIIPKDIPSLSIEAAHPLGWEKYVKHSFGIKRYGLSGQGQDVFKALGFTPENIVEVVMSILKGDK
jgi:transketolase